MMMMVVDDDGGDDDDDEGLRRGVGGSADGGLREREREGQQ